MHQTLQHRLKPILLIALVSLMVPAIALAQAELGSDPSSTTDRVVPHLPGLPSAATILDLKDSLHLSYVEQSLERQLGLGLGGVAGSASIRNVLRRAPRPAIAARVPRPSNISSGGGGGSRGGGGGYVSHSGADWNAIAMCESSGNWAANTGNGFWGGLQFTPSTWFAYGGGPFDGVGPFPYSSSEQIAVGERVLAAQGPGAWPNCFQWA